MSQLNYTISCSILYIHTTNSYVRERTFPKCIFLKTSVGFLTILNWFIWIIRFGRNYFTSSISSKIRRSFGGVRGVIQFFQAENMKFTEDLLQSMANMLWTRPVSENGAQCLGMGEQMFMTLRDQGDPLPSQMHWSKRWTASFERIDIS
jgi:hypothetical protein